LQIPANVCAIQYQTLYELFDIEDVFLLAVLNHAAPQPAVDVFGQFDAEVVHVVFNGHAELVLAQLEALQLIVACRLDQGLDVGLVLADVLDQRAEHVAQQAVAAFEVEHGQGVGREAHRQDLLHGHQEPHFADRVEVDVQHTAVGRVDQNVRSMPVAHAQELPEQTLRALGVQQIGLVFEFAVAVQLVPRFVQDRRPRKQLPARVLLEHLRNLGVVRRTDLVEGIRLQIEQAVQLGFLLRCQVFVVTLLVVLLGNRLGVLLGDVGNVPRGPEEL